MILTYFIIGVVFTFLIDLLINNLQRIGKLPGTIDWDMSQRVLCVILWPLAILWFISAFLNECFRRKD